MSTLKSSKTNNADNLIKLLLWYKNLKETTVESFFSLYGCDKRYLVLMGGAGSGKSIFSGRKLLERLVSEENHRFLAVRKVARTIRESQFTQLCSQISEYYDPEDFKINRTDMLIKCERTNSCIIFAGLDDVEKLKSIYNITGIWIEEASEISQSDFNQLDIRLRGETKYYKQIILSFNPIDINHWLKKRFFDTKDPRAMTHKSTYKTNKFLDDEAKEVLLSYKDTDPYYYTVYCLGEWGVYGKSIFDAYKISMRLSEITDDGDEGEFLYDYDGLKIYNIHFEHTGVGRIRIYKYPEAGFSYAIGADTAGEGSDNFAASVIKLGTNEQVACLWGQYDEDMFARQLYCLGMMYNNALLGVEANFSTYPIKELERLGYKNQYVRQIEDSYTHRLKTSYGFMTNRQTRALILADLVQFVRDNVFLINDRNTLEEMLTFVRNEKGRAEAVSGSHDDAVMAMAIALYVKAQQKTNNVKKKEKITYNFECEKPRVSYSGEGEKIIMI